MQHKSVRLGTVVLRAESTMELDWGGDLAQFQTEEPGDVSIFVRRTLPGEPTPQAGGYALIQRQGSRFEIGLPESSYPHPTLWQILVMLPLSELLLERGILTVHASYILHGGQGIAFSGASGAGKSTQAELWRRYRGAQVINGDRAFLMPGKDGTMIASHYLSGTSGICENVTAPLKAVVLLEQAGENGIVQASPRELFHRLLAQTDYQPADPAQLIAATALLEQLMADTTVCCYGCRMDETAVTCLKTHLFG